MGLHSRRTSAPPSLAGFLAEDGIAVDEGAGSLEHLGNQQPEARGSWANGWGRRMSIR